MNRKLTLVAGLTLCAGLAACATPRDAQQLSQKTVEYACGVESTPVTAHYTFQGGQALAARVIHQNQVIELDRSTTNNTDIVGNTFRGGGYTWTTEKFDEGTVQQAKGTMLTRDAALQGAVQPANVDTMLLRDCVVRSVS
jgi:membrane-bound inhibitor of C-type lysozyme